MHPAAWNVPGGEGYCSQAGFGPGSDGAAGVGASHDSGGVRTSRLARQTSSSRASTWERASSSREGFTVRPSRKMTTGHPGTAPPVGGA